MSDSNIDGLRDCADFESRTNRGLDVHSRNTGGYALKSLLDFCFALLAIVFFAPFMIVVAILIFAHDRGPVFFIQERIGQGGRKFPCLKFRTMVVNAQERLDSLLAESPEARIEWRAQQKLRNDPRITRVGRFLRTTSLDELPQFFNVLFGQMSVVGPRPIVEDEVPKYSTDFSTYNSVKPGVTGLWQVSGRSDTSYRERVSLDVQYVNSMSLLTDMSIILKTVSIVLNGRGAC
ncbi:sugar transferase [Oceanibium sediminis]|uniref:sugar transferase n=1 Tax=Oceanibium sediminis TaxID=2026339 RepID=UPI000DD4D9CF|nr:sugar transferase [Oceanibium sediminis]